MKSYNILVGTALTFLSFDAMASGVPDSDYNQDANSTASSGLENNHNQASQMESNPVQKQGVNGYAESIKILRGVREAFQIQEIARLVKLHGEIYSEYFLNASLYGGG